VASVYVSIGNSEHKLTQLLWESFWHEVDGVVRGGAAKVHGVWLSLPNAGHVNACWCVEFPALSVALVVRQELGRLAARYRQDAITWAECDRPEFLPPRVA
jgi:hypothetical protein